MILYTDSTLIPTIREVLEVWEEISSAIVEVFSLVRSQSVHALKCLLLDAVRAEFHGDTHTHTQTHFETRLCQHARKWSLPKLSATWANPAESFLAGTTLRFLNLLDFRLSQQRSDTPLIWQERRWEAAGTCVRGLEVYGLILAEEWWHNESVVAAKYIVAHVPCLKISPPLHFGPRPALVESFTTVQ